MRFERGTVCLDGADRDVRDLPFAKWDPRTLDYRIPAFRAPYVATRASVREDVPWPTKPFPTFAAPALRRYQDAALTGWVALGERGVVALPTGAGKTRVALAAIAHSKTSVAILCPTRALVLQWKRALEEAGASIVGIIADGERRVEDITVMTFESAYRHMDTLGDRFGLLVVDEAHHFGSGLRTEALEMCAAPRRLGLTATMPAHGTQARERLCELLGDVACEVGLDELLGVHLSDLDVVRLFVNLGQPERARYEHAVSALRTMRLRVLARIPGADWPAIIAVLSKSDEGRRVVREHQDVCRLASFPAAKKTRVVELLKTHVDDRTLVFTANVEDAYEVSRLALIPAITAETGRDERDDTLAAFREGRLRAIVAARVLNEGIDVPDAAVAILAGGSQGARELAQRVGRILRPVSGKRALVYEIITRGTIDERRSYARRDELASGYRALA